MISTAHVRDAAHELSGRVRRTPLLETDWRGARLWLKCEFMQHTGTFKARGATYHVSRALRDDPERARAGIVIASGGNAALAFAYAAQREGLGARVWVPHDAPEAKTRRIEALGAQVNRHGGNYAEAAEAARVDAANNGGLLAHAYDHPAMAAGAGTIGLEVLEDLPDLDTVVVAVGGGGLYAGLSAALAPKVRLVTVEPEGAPTLHAALAAGAPVDVPVAGVASDSLGARRIGNVAWSATLANAPHSVLVSDSQIMHARATLWEEWRIPSEHGAATAFAAISGGVYAPEPGERVAVIVCGANTDMTSLDSVPPAD